MIGIDRWVSLREHNTFGMSVWAEHFAVFESVEELKSCVKANITPLSILGGGSNILMTKDVEGLVLKNAIQRMDIKNETGTEVVIEVGGGVKWHDFVTYTVSQNWCGVENLALIPGTVGAAPIQNIGAYGVEQAEVFEGLWALDLSTLESRYFDKKDCAFGYRDSVFKQALKGRFCITSVIYKLSKTHAIDVTYNALQSALEKDNIQTPTLKNIYDTVIKVRQSKLPNPDIIGNGGSFFKNPMIKSTHFEDLKAQYPTLPGYATTNPDMVKVSAAFLIDQCGWKGRRLGDIGVHDKQALVLVNHGNGAGKDIWALAQTIKKDVWKRFDIEIEPEINIW